MGLVAEFAGLRPTKPTVVTVGRFDGVHRGHQYLLEQLRKEAAKRDALSVAIPLYPDPRVIHEPGFQALYLEALEERLDVLRGHVDMVVLVNYTWQLSRLTAREFMTALIEDLHLTCLVGGPNHTLGRDKLGTIPVLRELGEELGFEVVVVEPVSLGPEMVSSTLIREAVATGDVAKAARMLGRPFALFGPVVSGAGRGRTLGYPTANLSIEPQIILPADGIYATRAFLDEEPMPSVTSVGRRPTFDNGERLVEVHLLDSDIDLYGKPLRVEFLERLRDERRFDSVEALVAQMADDVESARLALARTG
jgi:riboflavin kinase/FMN adenylyltransferase